MSDLLIFTVAAGRYRVYADLFTFCCKRAYPQYDVQVWVLDGSKIAMMYPLDPLRGGIENLDIHYLSGLEKEHTAACMRFVINPATNHKYTYITDIDMMVIPENPTLLEFHVKEMQETGLCYSNRPRWKEPMGENRMTGLHFVSSQWWQAASTAMLNEAIRLSKGEIGSVKCDDELMLMRIVKNSGLPVTERGNLLERHHGIHLGTIRDYFKDTIQKRRGAVQERMKKDKAVYWCHLIETIEYKKLIAEIKKQDRQATMELTELEKFARQIGGVK